MFRIVFLCTGNRARSVIAEHAARVASEGLDIDIQSAGVLDLGAMEPLPEAVEAAGKLGLDLSMHRSRHMANVDLGTADLVIGFERDHIAAAVVDGGAAAGRTFALRELLRLLERSDSPVSPDPYENARVLIERAGKARKEGPVFDPDDDIADPLGRKPDYFDRVAGEITAGVKELIASLFGSIHA